MVSGRNKATGDTDRRSERSRQSVGDFDYGRGARKLIDDGRLAAVSRDGSQIAFIRGSDLNEELWVMQGDGERPRKVSTNPKTMYGPPAWSPDGQRIVFTEGWSKAQRS